MEMSEASYQIIADLLAARTGQQLTESRKWRLGSALSGVFRKHGIDNIDQLVCLLDQNSLPRESSDLEGEVVEALLNNETYFFRDKPTFDQIPQEILPQLRERRSRSKRLSIWCAGCSTGQEAHSLAMIFAEQRDIWAGWSIEILATDISNRAISAARQAPYNQFEIQRGLGVVEMLNHFDEVGEGWQLRDEVRKFTKFEQHNLLGTPPGRSQFDLILCRNVLLYFDAEKRSLAFSRLSNALIGDGFLMLGAGETTATHTSAFVPSGARPSIFEPTIGTNESQRTAA